VDPAVGSKVAFVSVVSELQGQQLEAEMDKEQSKP
jgi:hypothetical protein